MWYVVGIQLASNDPIASRGTVELDYSEVVVYNKKNHQLVYH
jgi:hypothetical protein